MSILRELRKLTPQKRTIQPTEARSIAERQARRFRILSGWDDEPMLPNQALLSLPRINVVLAVSMKSAGLSGWDTATRQFQIYINANDAPARQRFTLAHEVKHWVDYTSHHANFKSFSSYSAHDQAEDVCDYFAGCLLVPRHLLKAAWTDGIQNTRDLAQLFGVSKAAMRVRLRQTGIVPSGRHDWFERSYPLDLPALQSMLLRQTKVAA